MRMSYDKQRLLRDADGVPIPQYWDVEEETFKPMGKAAFDGDIHLESSEEAPVYTKLTGSNIGQGYFSETRTGTFPPGESFVVVDYDEPVIIDAMDWVPRNETQARIKIHVRGGGDQLINTLGTSTEGTFSPRDIVDRVSLFFDVVRFDLEVSPDPLMRFHLKEPLYFPDGVRITLYNRDDEESFRNSLQVRGRFA